MYNNCQKLYMFNGNAIKQIRFPLPSLETQQAIVAEIETEQALVDANRELIERFEKKIQDVVGGYKVRNKAKNWLANNLVELPKAKTLGAHLHQ